MRNPELLRMHIDAATPSRRRLPWWPAVIGGWALGMFIGLMILAI